MMRSATTVHPRLQAFAIYLGLVLPGLLGAAIFAATHPDYFLEMMLIVGPCMAAFVAGAISLVLWVIARAARKLDPFSISAVGVAAFVAFVLSFLWAEQNQIFLLEQVRLQQ
jgi:hypothetical protein